MSYLDVPILHTTCLSAIALLSSAVLCDLVAPGPGGGDSCVGYTRLP